MPRMDGTGPAGQGPMTGRGLGPCGSYGTRLPQNAQAPWTAWIQRTLGAFGSLGLGGYMRPRGGGRGVSGGRGGGRGRGRW
ncbi:MAG: DUF5320 domain-containing protein [Armatimonadota bacterium]